MKRFGSLFLIAVSVFMGLGDEGAAADWVSLFDGKSLDGWKASESQSTFTVKDGAIVVFGPRSHLFYVGPAGNHSFKNFEFQAEVMTTPGSNSGIYFHTAYQETGFPEKGFEVQVNNSHTDWKRTGGLYDIQDVREVPAPRQPVVHGTHCRAGQADPDLCERQTDRRLYRAGECETTGEPSRASNLPWDGCLPRPRPQEQGALQEHQLEAVAGLIE